MNRGTSMGPRCARSRRVTWAYGLGVGLSAGVMGGAPRDAAAGGNDLQISAEIDVDQPVLGPAWGKQEMPDVAFDGAQHLVVWHDLRSGTENVYGARVAADGTVLDPFGLRIAEGSRPVVAWGDDAFLVVFHSGGELRGARVGPSGEMLDPGGFPLAQTSDPAPAVAFDGANFLVLWAANSGSGGAGTLHMTRVAPDGATLDTGALLALNGSERVCPALAIGSAGSLAVWQEDARVRGARLDAQGELLDPDGFTIAPLMEAPACPSVTFDGVHYVVGWGGLAGLRAARITDGGAVVDAGGLLISDRSARRLDMAFDGAATVFVWDQEVEGDAEGVISARLNPDGGVLSTGPLVERGVAPAIAASSAGAFAVWEGMSWRSEVAIAGARLGPGGAVLDAPPRILAQSANGQVAPSIGLDGQSYLVTWVDERTLAEDGLSRDVRGARVTREGEVLDAMSGPIADQVAWEIAPRAVSDGRGAFVFWWEDAPGSDFAVDGDARSLRGGRVSAESAKLDAPQLDLGPGRPSWERLVAGAGAEGLLALAPLEAHDAALLRLDAEGGLAGATPIRGLDEGWIPQAIVPDSAGQFTVWIDSLEDEANAPGRLVVGSVEEQGAALAPVWIEIAPAAQQVRSADAAASRDGEKVVAWHSAAGTTWSVRAAVVTAAGEILPPEGIVLDERSLHSDCMIDAAPAVVFDGQAAVIAWRAPSDSCAPGTSDLLGARLLGSGEVAGFTISAEPGVEGPPALASLGGGHTLIAYARALDEAPYHGAPRVRVRALRACNGPCAGGEDTLVPGAEDPPDTEDPGGALTPGSCGCRAASRAPGAAGWIAIALGGVLGARRRRSRAGRRPTR